MMTDLTDEYTKTLREVSELAATIRFRAIDKLCDKVDSDDTDNMIYARSELLKILANYFGVTEGDVWPKKKK
jgi:hypothetical protein